MKTTTKNRVYYHELFLTPCYLMRRKLEEDYVLIIKRGLNSASTIAMVAGHLTAYNELVSMPFFFRMRSFKPTK